MASSAPHPPTIANITALLPKLNNADSDLRYMSLNDLFKALDAGSPTILHGEWSTCTRLVEGLLKTLDDTNGEVQNQAIKCLGPLAQKLLPEGLATLIEKVATLKTTSSVDNSIPATALRTIIASLPQPIPGALQPKTTNDAYSAISKALIPRLVGYVVIPSSGKKYTGPPLEISTSGPARVIHNDHMDVLNETIRCFGSMLQDVEKEALQKLILIILDHERTATIIKKKAVVSIAMLAVHLSDALLSDFISNLIERTRSKRLTAIKRRMLLTIIGSLARTIPHRLGPYLKTLAPFVLGAVSEKECEDYLARVAEEGSQDPETEEVREAALIALEDCLASCSIQMRPYTDDSVQAALRFLTYDPNLLMLEDEDEMGDVQGNASDNDIDHDDLNDVNDGEEDFEEEGGLDDDDDNNSWKVRRCAAKVLFTIISTRGSGDLLENGTLYDKVVPVLVSCFKEREESVRLQILAALSSLICKTGEGMVPPTLDAVDGGYASATNSRKRRRVGSSGLTSSPLGTYSPSLSPSPVLGPRADLDRMSPTIVQGISKLLKQSTTRTKQAGVSLLREMVVVRNGGLSNELNLIIDPLIDAITNHHVPAGSTASNSTSGAVSAAGSSLRIESLGLLRAICDAHSSRVLSPHMAGIAPAVIAAAKDKHFKVSGEAIITTESIIKVLTPPRSSGLEQQNKSFVKGFYDVILERITTLDTDLEVRQYSIHALGILLARTSGSAGAKLLKASNRSVALDILKERLKNETTRLPAVSAVDGIALLTTQKGELKANWVQEVSLELGAQLRKSDRTLRGASLTALKNITANPIVLEDLDANTTRNLVDTLLPMLNPQDLSMLSLALVILAKLVARSPRQVVDGRLNNALCTVICADISGHTLDAYLSLVYTVGEKGVGSGLMVDFLKNVGISGDPLVVGQAIGTLLVSGGSTVGVSTNDFKSELQSAQDDQRKCLSLSILGEIGLRLGPSSPLNADDFTSHFNSRSDRVPRAAAVALGRAGAGNVPVYLPAVLWTMNKSVGSQYLLLHSIKEILEIAGKNGIDLSMHTSDIWEKVLRTSQSEDNRAVGAECLGRLAIIEPKTFLPYLQDSLQDQQGAVRGMIIQATRFTFVDTNENFDDALKPRLLGMLKTMMNDKDLENRKLALITLTSAIANKSRIIFPYLNQLLPLVMKESKVRPELVREIQMGPFKHNVDDGLELRKSAYETLYTLMQGAYSRMKVVELFDRVIAGLDDEHDIKMLCSIMLTKLIALDPEETGRRMEQIAERLRNILTTKPKENAVKQEVEKVNEANKGALKVTILLQRASLPQGFGWKTYWEWVNTKFGGLPLSSIEHEVKLEGA